ncbi:MAG TPA: antibiotic biosynthesis monooxygenase [Acidobacteriota bacterium]|nr:antibiotic biosynthesis monooxygenase [Acidobacteriota bacterium]
MSLRPRTREQPEAGYVYIWEYRVHPKFVSEFEQAYGPKGPWVELFKSAKGYLSTELLRDHRSADRYLTIDSWDAAESWETFRSERASEFEAIDAECEVFTIRERQIGRYHPVG